MWVIFKKEIRSFLGSFIGYIVMGVFLILTGLFLWIIKGNTVFDLGVASLQVMFEVAPYILIFLVSAITMRSISDEKRLGTLEVLTTKPLTDTSIILGKFFASVTLILISIIPTLVYFYAVYKLASPVGNVDVAATIGSYFGLILLSACYAAMGMFSSSITDNQIVALIVSMLLNFFFFAVLGMLGDVSWLQFIGRSLEWFGLEYHYDSLSRGLIDTRDIMYFCGFIAVFLGLTKMVFESRKW